MRKLEPTKNGLENHRSLKNGEYLMMEKELHRWFFEQRKRHIPLNGIALKTKALDFQNPLYNS